MLILGLKQILRREEFIALLQALFSMLAITSLTCIVHSGGGLGSQKGVNVCGSRRFYRQNYNFQTFVFPTNKGYACPTPKTLNLLHQTLSIWLGIQFFLLFLVRHDRETQGVQKLLLSTQFRLSDFIKISCRYWSLCLKKFNILLSGIKT